MQPAVLPAGDYRLEVRSSRKHGSDAAAVLCDAPIHAEAAGVISLVVSFTATGCELANAPAPSPSPDTAPSPDPSASPDASPASAP